jgi:hypothetical protein
MYSQYFHEFHTLTKSLETIEAFVIELAAREAEVVSRGFATVRTWPTFEAAMPLLKDFDGHLLGLLEFSRTVDKPLHDAILKITEGSGLADTLGKLYISLKITTTERPQRQHLLSGVVSSLAIILRTRTLFLPNDYAHTILVALHRLTPLVKHAYDSYLANFRGDDEIFKPSNIDKTVVIDYLNNAIEIVRAAAIPPAHKDKLLSYLNQTKQNLAEKEVPWKNVIGALVVVATLLTGIAEAPHAYENVLNAIQYILGISIEKLSPLFLPAPPPNGETSHELGSTRPV